LQGFPKRFSQETSSWGTEVDASIACPLILSEIYRDMALGVQNFVLSDFPQSLKQAPDAVRAVALIGSV
jgi:hypothetical protein